MSAIPFGDIPALQDAGLIPRFQNIEAKLNTRINWGGDGGERPEIGIVPNDHAAVIGGQHELRDAIIDIARQEVVPEKGVSPAHKPNLYWLPFLLTGETLFAWRMQEVPLNPGHVKGNAAVTVPRRHAWNLRDLAQLAWLEKNEYILGTYYRNLLDESRLLLERIIDGDWTAMQHSAPVWAGALERFNLLGFLSASKPAKWGWKPWQNAFQGMALAHIVRLGFADWRPVLEYHFQHCRMMVDNWGLKSVDAYDVLFSKVSGDFIDDPWDYLLTANWDKITPCRVVDADMYTLLPDDELIDPKLRGPSGKTFRHWMWASQQYAWAESAAQLGVTHARRIADLIYHGLEKRAGPRWAAKTAILHGGGAPEPGPEPDPDPDPPKPETLRITLHQDMPAGVYTLASLEEE